MMILYFVGVLLAIRDIVLGLALISFTLWLTVLLVALVEFDSPKSKAIFLRTTFFVWCILTLIYILIPPASIMDRFLHERYRINLPAEYLEKVR